ncbi:MAG: 50S ribosomal protein L32 [Caldisericum sp.]|uniref:50S ribosomal protein L32 n=1 Tax=Caldisericum sp. TaxID=2499687 RepID=UPI003D11A13D
MAQPKKKTTHSRSRMRKIKEKLDSLNLVECPHCHNLIPPHKVCPYCGYYEGKEVVKVETKGK